MPKVKNPLFSQEARGGMAGLVYNTWRGINYVKQNTSPTGQGTQLRLAAQALIYTWSKVWATIGDTARSAWNQYAIDHPVVDIINGTKRLTGFNWYILCNINLARQGNAAITMPPTDPAPVTVSGFNLSQDVDDLFMTWSAPTAADLNVEVWLTGPHSKGRAPKIQMAHYQIAYGANAAVPVVLKAAAPIGRYTAFARVMDPVTGLVSTWISDFFDIT